MNTIELLDAAKRASGIESDYALAKALNISKQRMSHYRTGMRELEEDAVVLSAAKLAGLNPELTLVQFHAQKPHTAAAATAWRRIADMAKKAARRPMAAALLLAPVLRDLYIYYVN